MVLRFVLYLFCNVALMELSTAFHDDKPCLQRRHANRSIVCVCNVNYCDETTREPISKNTYVAYTSSEKKSPLESYSTTPLWLQCVNMNTLSIVSNVVVTGGLRFNKSSSEFQQWFSKESICKPRMTTLHLDPKTIYQTVQGFGGSVTDAVGIHYDSLADKKLKQHFVNSYFGPKGLQYNMIRVPIGGCDFSTHAYAYNEYPENDAVLSNYSLSIEDYKYKIPLIKDAFEVSKERIHVIASTWSPPTWMKTNKQFSGKSLLEEEYYQTYADYHKKFIEHYADAGIPIWAVTTTNEPANGLSFAQFNSLGWSVSGMGKFIKENLGPTLRNSTFDVKILAVDDQRFMIPIWFNLLTVDHPEALQYIDGVAVHFYFDRYIPASLMTTSMKDYPDKFLISTEACAGSFEWEYPTVDLGSWKRAERYIIDILEDLNHNTVGWIDWNLALGSNGGPNWAQNYADSPVIVFPEEGEFVKQPMFYAMGHFSKFIPRGSLRIDVTTECPTTVQYSAFKTPNNTLVAVLFNIETTSSDIILRLNDNQAQVSLPAKSIATIEFNNE